MSGFRFALTAVAVLGLTACSGPEQKTQADTAASPDAPSAATAPPPGTAPASASGGAPLGGGSSLTGASSTLTGQITGFTFRQTDTQTIVELAADVLFAFDSADLTPGAEAGLRRTAELAAQGGTGTIQVVGHTDAKGDDAYNLALSKRRAEAVVRWLSSSGGIATDQLRAEGRGKTEPVAPNTTLTGQDDPEGRARNRRVVVIIPR